MSTMQRSGNTHNGKGANHGGVQGSEGVTRLITKLGTRQR